MPFIGQEPLTGAYHVLDAITTSATATYNLQLNSGAFSPATANQLLVSLNGVIQKPGSSFTISGSQITFSSALTSSDSIDFIIALGDVLNVGTPTDGSVTNGKIANSTIDLTSKVTGILPTANGGTGSSTYTAGKTLGVTKFSSNTRTALSGGNDIYDYFTGNVTQVKANSKFLVHVHLIGFSHSAGAMNFDLIYDGTTHQGGSMFVYTAQTYPTVISGLYYIDGSSSAGSKAITFRQNLRSSTGKPFDVWNPNHTDDARLEQTVSNVIFVEYDF